MTGCRVLVRNGDAQVKEAPLTVTLQLVSVLLFHLGHFTFLMRAQSHSRTQAQHTCILAHFHFLIDLRKCSHSC